MIWSGREIMRWVSNISSDQLQPNGIDLKVSEIYSFKESGTLMKHERVIPKYKKLNSTVWFLRNGAYLIRYNEYIRVPPNAIAIVLPRSSLLRMGATIYTALWDSGYEGRGIGLLHVFNPHGIKLEKGARVAQIIFISARSTGTYTGIWKGEGREI